MQLTLSQMWEEMDPGAEGVSWLSVTGGQVLQKCAAEDIVEEGAEQTEVGGSFLISGLMKHNGYGRALWKDPHLWCLQKVHCFGRKKQGASWYGSSPELSHGVKGWCHQHTNRKLPGLSFIPA